MMICCLKRPRRLCLASLLLGTAALPGFAQPAPVPKTNGADVTVLDPIILTGEKRDRSLRDTAASAAVVTDVDVKRKTTGSVAEALTTTPNVVYTDTVGAPVIRGQDAQGPNFGSSAFFGGTMPRATTNLDGHYLTYFENVFGTTSIWDVDTIEVFRGPQTTAQGTNSIAGALIVRTKDPEFTRKGAVQLQYGSRGAYRASIMASGPLSDSLAARLTLDSFGRNSFITYTNPVFKSGNHDFAARTARLKLLWRPADLDGTEVKLTFAHNNSSRPTIEAATGDIDTLESATRSMPNYDLRNNSFIGDVTQDLDNGVRLIGQLQFSNLNVRRVIEPAENGAATLKTVTKSVEMRAVFGQTEDLFSGLAGLFYSHVTSDDTLNVRGLSHFDDDKKNLGLFGEMSWRPDPRWTLTGALRYQRDDITRQGTTPFAPTAMDFNRRFDAWLPKVSVSYEASPEWNVGALVSRGYNPGGLNLSFATRQYIPFDKETVWNYELFARGTLLDGRLNVNGNLFYADYHNSQRLLPDYIGGLPYGVVVVNADAAKAYGLELQADYQANDAVQLRGALGLLHTRIGEFKDALGQSYDGNEFARSPGYMLSLGADWAPTPELRISGDIRHIDGYYSDDENRTGYAIDPYTVANAKVSYTMQNGLELYAYAENLFDAHAATWKFDDRTAGGVAAAMVKPREIGMGLRMDF